MKRILIILAVIVVLLGGAWWIFGDQFSGEKPRISEADRAAVRLIPLPASMELSGKEFSLGNGVRVQLEGYPDQRIQKAVDRMMDVLGVDDLENSPQTLQIICVEAMPDPLPVRVDESYRLSVAASRITLIGNTPVGVLHGLETLIQLATEGDNGLNIPGLELNDEPRFPWRGMMIDVSRHWIPKEMILRQLDALAAVKMNVFHWHLSDDQGFRVESKTWPLLHEVGSNGDYYTQEEIREVVSYAYDRGIRVVPEFDIPGHATAIIAAYPELGSGKGGELAVSDSFGIHVEVMNPTSQKTYAFLDGLIQEMAGLFPDPYFHIGGDEVNPSHWEENPSIQAFMEEKELEDAEALQAYFNKEIQAILKKHGKKMVGWDEILHPELPKDIVAQVWRDHTSLLEAALGGNQGILSAGYYLDFKLPAAFHYDVDPLKVKGGIIIEPDSIWRHWDLELNVRGNTMESEITLFGQGEELRGVVNTLGNYTTMENPSLENDRLNFQLTTQFGTATFEGEIRKDSLVGQMSLSIIDLEAMGKETGSSDIAGSSPPELKRVPDLTEEAQARILGGETCMWLEVADQTNLESRLWPRSAAIAEKFWSLEELTGDVEDMYRRMYLMSQYLDLMGLEHLTFSDKILKGIVGSEDIRLLQELVSVLEEAKYYERHSQTMVGQRTTTPLNNLVDATYPESEVARQFSLKVDAFLADSLHETHKASLREQLVQWKENQKELQEQIPGFTRDQENIMTHSQNLELVSEVGILLIDAISNHTDLSDEQKESWQVILNEASGGKGGIILPIAPAVQKLLTASSF